MDIVVTGGLGQLGREVVEAVRALGHAPRIASRRTGVDLTTGMGLAHVLDGAAAVIHTADSLRPWEWKSVTLNGTRRLAEAIAPRPAPPHLVYISIVGIDRNPYPYYRAKLAAEEAIEETGIPATIVRATQFHSLIARFGRAGRVGPVALGLTGMRAQPVDRSWVAERLAAIATGPPPSGCTRHADLAGPDCLTMAQVATLVAEHTGRRPPRMIDLPAVGATARAFTDGSLLPCPGADLGGRPFADRLATQPTRLPRR